MQCFFAKDIYHNPSNNVPRILIETHETPFLGSIWRKINLEIKLIKVLTNSVNIVLSNKYLEAIIQSLESKIFNEKVEDLLYEIKMIKNKTLTFSLNILGSRHCMLTSKYSFDRKKFGLQDSIFIFFMPHLILL